MAVGDSGNRGSLKTADTNPITPERVHQRSNLHDALLNTNLTCACGPALSKSPQNDQIEWFRCK
jgi:hypothetical protein